MSKTSRIRPVTSKPATNKPTDMTFQKPCTLAECLQISRASAEDAIVDYHQNTHPMYVSMSLQIEIIKDILISSGMITEDEFKSRYMEKAEEFQRMQREMYEAQVAAESDHPTMQMSAGDVEVTKED